VHVVWVNSLIWPDFSFEDGSIGVLNEDVLSNTRIVSLISLSRSSTDTSIYDRDEFHVPTVKLINIPRKVEKVSL